LDLGCGNGHFLHEINKRGHGQTLLGVDFSLPLLRDAESAPNVSFREVDLIKLPAFGDQLSIAAGWSLITAFAVLHHIPSNELRLDILKTVHGLLKENGRFVLSNWQFLNSERLKARIQPWSKAGLSDEDVDEGDYLLDWRNGGEGLRYVHHFSVDELHQLAEQAGMRVSESFLSDGDGGRLGLYQIWTPA
jgi:SAM-dependent methyltransferase